MATKDAVDKGGTVPLYVQVKRKLRQAILDGTLWDRAPSERQLARRYDIAQMTARRAIMDLVAEGVLYRQVGRGTFVRGGRPAARRACAIGFALCPAVTEGAANPYFSRVLAGAERAARRAGFSVVFTARIDDLLAAGADGRRRVDGVLAVAWDDAPALRRLARRLPTVLLDSELPAAPCVLADNVGGAEAATEYLAGLGHRRIAHLAGHQRSAMGRDRLAGYRRALARRNLPAERGLVVPCGFTFEAGYAAAGRLVRPGLAPSAAFCVNDAVALGAMKRLGELGLGVPGDISLVGFDDIEPASMVAPALTTVHVPQEQIGALAAEELLRMILHPDRDAPEACRRVAVRLVERDSCRRLAP